MKIKVLHLYIASNEACAKNLNKMKKYTITYLDKAGCEIYSVDKQFQNAKEAKAHGKTVIANTSDDCVRCKVAAA